MDMKTSIDLNTDAAPPAIALPLSLLALMDLAQLKREYAQFLHLPPEEDQWLVTRGAEALPPQSFQEVLRRLARGEGPLLVLRMAEADVDPTPWQTLDYRATASNRAAVLVLAIGFWALAVFSGWVAVEVIAPRAHLGMWERVYFAAALAAVVWLCLPEGLRGKVRGR